MSFYACGSWARSVPIAKIYIFTGKILRWYIVLLKGAVAVVPGYFI